MTDYPMIEELQKAITWSIEQGGNDNYILNDNNYSYIWGYYLYIVKEQKGTVILAQTRGQLMAVLTGEPQPTAEELPNYNIDWDIRNGYGDILQLKKKDGTSVPMMGTFEFDTPEQGAERWLEQIKECVPKGNGLWVTSEERHEWEEKFKKEFKDYFDAHCSYTGDCKWKESCEVRWSGGHGLRGCRRENPDDEEMWKDE